MNYQANVTSGFGDVELDIAQIEYFVVERVYALDRIGRMIYEVYGQLQFQQVTPVPAHGVEFRVEDALCRMRSTGELEHFNLASWVQVVFYPTWGEADSASRNHSTSDHTEAPGPPHIDSTIQPSQADEYYESDLEGSLTSSECDSEEGTTPARAPLLGSLVRGMQEISFSPPFSTTDDYEPTSGSTFEEPSFNTVQVEPGENVVRRGYAINYEYWPQDLQVVDWRHPTRENVLNLVDFFKEHRNANQRHTKVPLLCPVVGCHKVQRRPQALRDHLFFHFAIKPFECLHCQRAFETKANMGRHTKTCLLLPSSNEGTEEYYPLLE
ncbi:hypothetical protein BDV93DRAFT_508210 [Ceratobasidium sp. AG-I]|nr:hypothetical protein BDV93DRAFT_508210 [Ceratobasidium sp. AG-I]